MGEVAEQFLIGAATAGVAKLPSELEQILVLHAAHGEPALLAALARAVEFRRWRADDVRSILAAGGAGPKPSQPGRRSCSPCRRSDQAAVGLRVGGGEQ